MPAPRIAAGVATLATVTGLIAACDFGSSPAFQAYKAFVDATVRGDCDALYGLAEHDAVGFVDGQCKRRRMTLGDKTIDLGSIASNVAGVSPSSTPFNNPISLERTLESETRSPDGKTVDLVVLEKSFYRNGSVREPTWLRQHTATVQLRDGKWKVTRFREEILKKYDKPGSQ